MKIRLAETKDLTRILELYEIAKALLRDRNVDQWQDGYPNEASATADINAGSSYVLEDDGTVIGTAYIAVGTEPTYSEIHNGKWLTDSVQYGFVHRVTLDTSYSGKGLAGQFFTFAKDFTRSKNAHSLRCDTHEDNLAMQKTLERAGFTKCGIIFLESGDKRLGYEIEV